MANELGKRYVCGTCGSSVLLHQERRRSRELLRGRDGAATTAQITFFRLALLLRIL